MELLRQVWIQNCHLIDAEVRWRSSENIPPPSRYIGSPYDDEAHYSKKRSTTWVGFKVHLTESCEPQLPLLVTHVETTSASYLPAGAHQHQLDSGQGPPEKRGDQDQVLGHRLPGMPISISLYPIKSSYAPHRHDSPTGAISRLEAKTRAGTDEGICPGLCGAEPALRGPSPKGFESRVLATQDICSQKQCLNGVIAVGKEALFERMSYVASTVGGRACDAHVDHFARVQEGGEEGKQRTEEEIGDRQKVARLDLLGMRL